MLKRSGMKLARNRTRNRQADDDDGKDTVYPGLTTQSHNTPRFEDLHGITRDTGKNKNGPTSSHQDVGITNHFYVSPTAWRLSGPPHPDKDTQGSGNHGLVNRLPHTTPLSGQGCAEVLPVQEFSLCVPRFFAP